MSFDDAPWLVGVTGPVTDLKVKVIGTEITIGRDKGCDICVEDDQVSAMHAGIVQSDDGLMVIDMNSEKGTFVNDILVTGPKKLANGDRIKLGGAVFRVHYPSASSSGTSMAAAPAAAAAAPAAGGSLFPDIIPLLKRRSVQAVLLALIVAAVGLRLLTGREDAPAVLPSLPDVERAKLLAGPPMELPKVLPDRLLSKLYLDAGKKLNNPGPMVKHNAEEAYVCLKLAVAYSQGSNDRSLVENREEASRLLDAVAGFLGRKEKMNLGYRWENIQSDVDALPADVRRSGQPGADENLANEYYERGRTYLMVMFLEPGNGIKAWRNLKCFLALQKAGDDPERVSQVRDWLKYAKERIEDRVDELRREIIKKEKLHLWDDVKANLMETMALLECKENANYQWAQTRLKDLATARKAHERTFSKK